ncbi:MAG TPA: hypothetical protein VIG25_11550 [Pyrinomonadaceae bacterium]|jgi:hypothetical protein
MINQLFNKLYGLSPSVTAAARGTLAIVAFLIGVLLQPHLQRINGSQPGDKAWGLSWILILILVAVTWGILQYWYRRTLASYKIQSQTHERAIADARERVTALSVEQLAQCDKVMEKERVTIDELRSVLICDLERISGLIKAAWEVVNSHHNISTAATERINFEMTLITASLRDSELTIASWCNRDNIRPKSLGLRAEGEKEIYRRTEAAKMITRRGMETLVIEDTSDPATDYEALYEGQKTRIRSSVLHPVLSPKGQHLGVLVLHCEREDFFRNEDCRYWHELFSVFAPSIALELERIRAFNKATSAWPNPPISEYEPY